MISRNEEHVNKIALEKYQELSEAVEEMVKERSMILYKPISSHYL